MTTLTSSALPCCELLEPRIQMSGAADLVHTTATFADTRVGVHATSNGGKAFFAGGVYAREFDFLDADLVTVYEAATGQSSTLHLSAPRILNFAVTVGGKSVFADGYNQLTGFSAVVDIYDGTTGAFTASTRPRLTSYAVAAVARDKVLFAGDSSASPITDVFDPITRQWSTTTLPRQVFSDAAAAVVTGNYTLIVSPGGANLFDSVTGRWSGANVPFARSTRSLTAAVAGSKAVVVDDTGRVGIYNFVTHRWTTTHLRHPRTAIVVAAVGSKVIIAGGVPPQNANSTERPVDNVDVYDVITGRWSATHLNGATSDLAATTVGRTAIFAFGSAFSIPSGTGPDLFTDTNPSPLYTGSLSGHANGQANLTLFNTGDAGLTGPYTIEVYASADRTLKGAIPLGKLHVDTPLAAGASVSLQIPTAMPRSARHGAFFLLAVVVDGTGRRTAVAASATAFHVKPSAAAWG